MYVCICSPESAVEPRSLAMMLPAPHSSTRRLNWQLGEKRQGHIMLRWRGLRQIKSKGNLREFRPEADMNRWSGWEFNFFLLFYSSSWHVFICMCSLIDPVHAGYTPTLRDPAENGWMSVWNRAKTSAFICQRQKPLDVQRQMPDKTSLHTRRPFNRIH